MNFWSWLAQANWNIGLSWAGGIAGLLTIWGFFRSFRKDIKDSILHECNAVGQRLTERMDAMDQRLTEKMDTMDKRLTEKMDTMDKRLTEKMDTMDKRLTEKMDAMDQRLTERMDAMDKRLSARIDAVDEKLSERINSVEKVLSAKIDAVEKRLGNVEEGVKLLNIEVSGLSKEFYSIKGRVDTVEKDQRRDWRRSFQIKNRK